MNLLKIDGILFYATMIVYVLSVAGYFVFFVTKKLKFGDIASTLFITAFLFHTATLILRGIAAQRLPLTNQFEFALSFAWGVSICYLIFLFRFKFKALGAFVTPVIFLIMGYAAMQSQEVKALMPALQSNWLFIHVTTSIIAYGAYGVAFAVGIMFLLKERKADSDFWAEHIPSARKLDVINYRAISLGFLFLTFTMITGAIWGEQAWGSYWNWDPKETWALITWFVYAIYLHQRIFNKKMTAKICAIYATVGFVAVLFTYVGVNTLLPGVHSYA